LIGPKTDIQNKYGLYPLEACFIDDMESILDHVISVKFDDPYLQVGKHNIERLIRVAIDHHSVRCLEVLFKTYSEVIRFTHSDFKIDWSKILIQQILRREYDEKGIKILEMLF
jgi:hypothetical protein